MLKESEVKQNQNNHINCSIPTFICIFVTVPNQVASSSRALISLSQAFSAVSSDLFCFLCSDSSLGFLTLKTCLSMVVVTSIS